MAINRSSFQQLAEDVWTLVSTAVKTVNIAQVLGTAINPLISGRIDADCAVLRDKTGITLTPGSYAWARSVQHFSVAIGNGASTGQTNISSVNTSKAFFLLRGFTHTGAPTDYSGQAVPSFNSATQVGVVGFQNSVNYYTVVEPW
jgi:hypothetical protein